MPQVEVEEAPARELAAVAAVAAPPAAEAPTAVLPAFLDEPETAVLEEPETAVMEPQALPLEPETTVLEPIVDAEPVPAPEVSTDPTPTESFVAAMRTPPPARRRRWVPWVAILVALVGAYLVAAIVLRDSIPDGTTIEGVPAGDTVADATAVVNDLAAAAAIAPVTLTAGDNSTELDPEAAGLAVDVDATVAGAGGFTLNPGTLWHRLTGDGTDHELVVRAAEPAFTDAVDAAADELDSVAADASVTIEGVTAVANPGSQNVEVDREAARDDVLESWPTTTPVELTADVTDPDVTTSEANALAATLTSHVFAWPTTLTGPNGDAVLPAARVAENSTVVAADGTLAWQVDGEALSELMLEAYPKIENKPVDASYHFTKAHKLKVTKGKPGRELDAEGVDDAVIAAGGTSTRTAPIPYIETEPDVTAEELPTQDFTKRISHFDTPLTPEPIRTLNLVRAAELVTGTVIKPGDRFDLTKVLSPIDASNGFYEAHVIVDGVFTTGMGGGLSQMATTSYNAGYFAGYDDIEHRPHSVWFPRYPAGRESTIYSGQINVVFENTTPYAAIMNSYVENGRLHVDIWSTPYYRVETSASQKTNFVQPTTVEIDDPNCEAKGKGEPGFKITNTRRVYHDDELVEERSWTWTYKPDNAVKCVSSDD